MASVLSRVCVDDCTRPGGKPCGFVLIEESVIVSPPTAVRRQVPGSEALVELDPHPRGALILRGLFTGSRQSDAPVGLSKVFLIH
jgi:hypothetical protein